MRHHISSAFVAAIVAALLVLFMPRTADTPGVPAAAPKKETAFERVMRTGVIRCGYYVFPPVTYRDANTQALSGFSVDMMESLGKQASLKIEWTMETTFASWTQDIAAGRFDLACTPMWPSIGLARVVDFTTPMFFAGLSPVVKTDNEKLKDADLARLNAPDVTIVTQDGDSSEEVIRATFPKAKFYALPAGASAGEYFQTLLTNKADAVVTDRNGLYNYEKNNGSIFRVIDPEHPVKLQYFTLAADKGEVDLVNFINQAINEMNSTGEMDRLLRKWEDEPGLTFRRMARPFQ